MATTEPRKSSPTGAWREQLYEATPERPGELFSTISGIETEPLYTSESGKGKPLTWIPPQDIERAQEILISFGAVKNRQPIEMYFTNEFVPGA